MEKSKKPRTLRELKRIKWEVNGDIAKSLREWRKNFTFEEYMLLCADADRSHDREVARRALSGSKAAKRRRVSRVK